MKKYITSDPQIMSGMPVIAGTRIPIVRILYLVKHGYTIEEIQQDYNHVPLEMFEKVFEELAEMFHHTSPHEQKVS